MLRRTVVHLKRQVAMTSALGWWIRGETGTAEVPPGDWFCVQVAIVAASNKSSLDTTQALKPASGKASASATLCV